jgi:lysophospholipase L1-like esterase
MSEDVSAAITRLADYVHLQGGTFVLMIEPPRFPGKVGDDVVQRYLATVRDLANDLEVELLDTYSVGWAEDLYADEVHFNREGTVAFSELVYVLLEELP